MGACLHPDALRLVLPVPRDEVGGVDDDPDPRRVEQQEELAVVAAVRGDEPRAQEMPVGRAREVGVLRGGRAAAGGHVVLVLVEGDHLVQGLGEVTHAVTRDYLRRRAG